MRATAKILGARASDHSLNFASKSSKGKILRAVKIFNGPFIIPYTVADGVRANKQLLCLALLLNKVSNSVEQK